jgi:hypothetical protein
MSAPPRVPCGRSSFVSGPPPALFASYLQPGVSVVCPGGWHFAFASFGPPPLLPGPKDGAANAGAAVAIAMRLANNTAITLRFICSHLLSLSKQKPAHLSVRR